MSRKEWAEAAIRAAVKEVEDSAGDVYRWVDPETGELLEDWRLGALEMIDEPEEIEGDSEWLGDWFTRKRVQIEAERAALKAQYKIRMGLLDSRDSGLEWKFGARLQHVVEEKILDQGGKKRSVAFAYGSAGFRKSKRLEITDEAAAIEWAEDNCPEAVKVKASLLKSCLPDSGEIPGVERIERDEFWVRGAKE